MPLSDGKERSKIREKKWAHGLKEGSDTFGYDGEVYDSQVVEGILTMLDYLISLGDQGIKQDINEQFDITEEYDFDNAYAEFLDGDADNSDDYDDDEEEQFDLSM